MNKQRLKQKIIKAGKHHLNNIEILKSREPSEKELEEMYGYLDYCFVCDKKLKFLEPFSHGFEGNTHKFGCSIPARTLGYLYQAIKIITIPIWFPILLILIFISWLREEAGK